VPKENEITRTSSAVDAVEPEAAATLSVADFTRTDRPLPTDVAQRYVLGDPQSHKYIDQAIEYRREHVVAQPKYDVAKITLARALTEKGYSPEATRIMCDQLQRFPRSLFVTQDSCQVMGKNAKHLRNANH